MVVKLIIIYLLITFELNVMKSAKGIIIKAPVINNGFIPDGPANSFPLK